MRDDLQVYNSTPCLFLAVGALLDKDFGIPWTEGNCVGGVQ